MALASQQQICWILFRRFKGLHGGSSKFKLRHKSEKLVVVLQEEIRNSLNTDLLCDQLDGINATLKYHQQID